MFLAAFLRYNVFNQEHDTGLQHFTNTIVNTFNQQTHCYETSFSLCSHIMG